MSGRQGNKTRLRRWWILLVLGAGLMGLLSLVGVVACLFAGEWAGVGMNAAWVVASYWFAVGAWLRTPWGRPEGSSPPPPPELTYGRARAYTTLAVACVTACAIALAAQVIAGRW